MPPTKPFIYCLVALAVVGAGVVLPATSVREVAAKEGLPLSTKLTPAMIDYFGLSEAFVRPSIAALVQCSTTPACAASDSSRLRFVDSAGRVAAVYDGKPSTTIEQVRRLRTVSDSGVTEARTMVRRYVKDEQGRIVMNGSDSIVKVDPGAPGRERSTLIRVHRFNDVRYLVTDPTFVWPLTGLVVLELSNVVGPPTRGEVRTAGHAAVSFDGTRYAHVLTTGALSHRVDLQARLLETTLPDR
jgi:hypothetical protein